MLLTYGFAIWLSKKLGKKENALTFAVGRDSRVSGPDIAKCVTETLVLMGANVIDCGMATTPSMFMTTVYDEVRADGSIMITASHLPMERNGLKFFTKEGGLDKPDIKALVEFAENAPDVKGNGAGNKKSFDLLSLYAEKTRNLICKELNEEELNDVNGGIIQGGMFGGVMGGAFGANMGAMGGANMGAVGGANMGSKEQ